MRTILKMILYVFVIVYFIGIHIHQVLAENTLSEKIIISVSNTAQTDATLYSVKPDGSDKTKLFNFQNHPAHKIGGIWHPRISPDHEFIYFCSDNCNLYTTADRNLFKIASDGSSWYQLTPGPHSGRWSDPCPCGIVQGYVKKDNGDPWYKSPVYLEGMISTTTDAAGFYYFENVPQGLRWIVAYQPTIPFYDAQRIDVMAGVTAQIDLTPVTSNRDTYQYPIFYGERICFLSGTNTIQWMQENSDIYTTVYTASECAGLSEVNGFDAGSVTGRLAIMDYQEGCPFKQGLYITDQNGAQAKLIVNLQKDPYWCGAQEVFWSPDESKLAVNVCYGWYTYLLVYEAETGKPIGSYYFPDQKLTLSTMTLHGWSPDGNWLLFSYYLEEPSQGVLSKIRVNTNGSIDKNSIIDIMTQTCISGATWGIVAEPGVEVSKRTRSTIIENYILEQNHPNPFNPVTHISFILPDEQYVKLSIFNTQGQCVRTLVDREMEAGRHDVILDASHLASGVYFYHITAGAFSDIKKMILLQ